MAITDAQISLGKDRLPRGWGRFGKALDHLEKASTPDESLLATCIGINPDFQMRAGTFHTLVGVERFVSNYFQDTNLLLAATDRRIIAVATGLTGAPRGHTEIPYEGLEVTRQEKKELELRWPGGSLHLKGIHKKVLPEFADTVRSQAGGHTSSPA
jgi:hypothetical protein